LNWYGSPHPLISVWLEWDIWNMLRTVIQLYVGALSCYFFFSHFTISSLKTPLLQLISDLVVDLLSLNSLYTQLSFYISPQIFFKFLYYICSSSLGF
jgi:hypothetical protein